MHIKLWQYRCNKSTMFIALFLPSNYFSYILPSGGCLVWISVSHKNHQIINTRLYGKSTMYLCSMITFV